MAGRVRTRLMKDTKIKASFWSVPAPTHKELRFFGFLMFFLSGSLAGFLYYREVLPHAFWIAGLSVCFLGCSLVWNSILRPLYQIWMVFSRVLGFVNTHILLALIFYTVFTVMGFLMRILRYDPLNRTFFLPKDGSVGTEGPRTYWSKRKDSLNATTHFLRQF